MVGSFFVTVLDGDGNTIAELERTTRGGRPVVGEELVLDGIAYRVERVSHEDEAIDATRRRYVEPHLYVRAVGARSRRRGVARVLSLTKP